MAEHNISVDIQCVKPMTREEKLKLQKVLRRMKRMGIAPSDRDHVILSLEDEIDQLRKRLMALMGSPMPAPKGANVFYVCDRRACTQCLSREGCGHTPRIEHAKHFELRGNAFWEQECADE